MGDLIQWLKYPIQWQLWVTGHSAVIRELEQNPRLVWHWASHFSCQSLCVFTGEARTRPAQQEVRVTELRWADGENFGSTRQSQKYIIAINSPPPFFPPFLPSLFPSFLYPSGIPDPSSLCSLESQHSHGSNLDAHQQTNGLGSCGTYTPWNITQPLKIHLNQF